MSRRVYNAVHDLERQVLFLRRRVRLLLFLVLFLLVAVVFPETMTVLRIFFLVVGAFFSLLVVAAVVKALIDVWRHRRNLDEFKKARAEHEAASPDSIPF